MGPKPLRINGGQLNIIRGGQFRHLMSFDYR